MNRYLSDELIDSLEECVAGAIRRIEAGEITPASVALTLSLKLNDDGQVLGEFQERATSTRKGLFDTHASPRLPFETDRRGTISVSVP